MSEELTEEEMLKEFNTDIFVLFKYSEKIFYAYNEAMKLNTEINGLTTGSEGYILANLIANLGIYVEVSNLFKQLQPLVDAYKQAYETGAYLNQLGLVSNTDLMYIKNCYDELSKININNFELMYNYFEDTAKKIIEFVEKVFN